MPRWDELESTLVRSGAAPRYAHRLREELSDHHTDLVEEHVAGGASVEAAKQAADEALGEIHTIVRLALTCDASRSLARTRPSVVFLAGPLAAVLACVTLAVGLVQGLAWLALDVLGWAQTGTPFRVFAGSIYALIAFGLLPGLALLFCAQAWLSQVPMRWALAACLVLALVGGLGVFGYHLESPETPGGTLHVGLGWEPRALRLALPLLTFLAFRKLLRFERTAAILRTLRRFAV